MTTRKMALVLALTAGALLAGAPDAHAGPGRGGNRKETVRLARPADGPSTTGRGSITITQTRRGPNATLKLNGLDRRAMYDVVDGVTGDVLGQVRTNRRGGANFDLMRAKRGKRAAAAGEDANDVPDVVDVVDPETGETVLTGDTTGELQALFGYATLGNGTESVSISMGSDPSYDTQYFVFSYSVAGGYDDYGYGGYYELFVDTASGGELPLGATSVLDLAMRDFQVRDANGEVAFRGTLPDVEAYEIEEAPPCPGHDDWEWEFPDVPDENWPDDGWYEIPEEWDWEMPYDPATGMGNGARWFKGPRNDEPPADEPAAEFTLWIESGDGFVKAGELLPPDWGWVDEPWTDDPTWDDDWGWEDDWGTWEDPFADWNWDDWNWMQEDGSIVFERK